MLRPFLPNSRHSILWVSGVLLCLLGFSLAIFNFWTNTHLPIRAELDGVNLSNLAISQAEKIFLTQVQSAQDPTLSLTAGLISATASASTLGITKHPQQALAQLISDWKQLPWWDKLMAQLSPTTKFQRRTPYATDQAQLAKVMAKFEQQINVSPKPPQVSLTTTNQASSLKVYAGEPGQTVDVDQTQTKLIDALNQQQSRVEVVTQLTGEVWDASASAVALANAKKVVGKTVLLTESSEHIKIELNDKQLVAIFGHPAGLDQAQVGVVVKQVADQVNRPPQDAKFIFDKTTMKVTEFVPDKAGLGVDETQLAQQLASQTQQLSATTSSGLSPIGLVMKKTTAQTPLSATNDLGISSLIGYGESKYAHSIATRIFNVSLATSRVNNYLVPPDTEFSFNKAIGDVSRLTGFKPAYIIQNGQTVLGDGGGVCQVSTTLFRALLNAGLPITRRLPHSYRVSYYELDSKPGVDATVFSGNTDLRFKNDTGHYILIHGEADPKNLAMYFELYGTDSGRRGQIVNHVTWDAKPALATQYIPDPSLPTGAKKQIDWSAPGIKAKFTNRVTDKDGNTLHEDVYTSNYRPWAAKYLVGP